jgi:hypothetical protein
LLWEDQAVQVLKLVHRIGAAANLGRWRTAQLFENRLSRNKAENPFAARFDEAVRRASPHSLIEPGK